jgi:hypothetical protein
LVETPKIVENLAKHMVSDIMKTSVITVDRDEPIVDGTLVFLFVLIGF